MLNFDRENPPWGLYFVFLSLLMLVVLWIFFQLSKITTKNPHPLNNYVQR